MKKLFKQRKFRIIALATLVLFLLGMAYTSFGLRREAKATDVFLKFDEGYGTSSAVKDSNGAVSAGSITNAVWKTEDLCKVGKCLYFDGTGDYVSFTDDDDLDMAASDNVTIELWFRTADITSGTRTLISKYETGGSPTDGGYKITINSSGQIVFGIDSDDTSFPLYSVTTSSSYDDNKWHFLTAVKSGTSSMTVYVDAISPKTTTIASTDASNNDTFYIGIDNGSSNGWLGFIDEVKVLRSARTEAEIKADFTGETPSRGTSASFGPNQSYLSDGLAGYWKMDEGSANTCTTINDDSCDSSGNVKDGAWYGDTASASGKFGNSVTLDGTGDYVEVEDIDF